MWQQTNSFLLILSVVTVSHPWSMTVPPKVTVSRGEDAVLWCSFTHPRQQDYSGLITVKWIARESRIGLFYSCSVKNTSMEELRECSASTLRYSLSGDPRRGELSLLIRKVELTDEGTFFCRVELDGQQSHIQKEVHLYVEARPEILSLSVMKSPSGSDSAPQRLRCEVEGHPPPKIVWLSASRRMKEVQVQTSKSGPYRVVSSVPYQEGEVLTCRAESRLGEVERGYPPSNTLMITLTVCGLIALLLLLLVGVLVYCLRNRARADTSPVYPNAQWRITDNMASSLWLMVTLRSSRFIQLSPCPAPPPVSTTLL
uniref:sialic acid binding Ig-like lectin 15, like isoform X2 n=1 Tax=Monopterus albus TaxID=43700 RepID=UPI0009B41C9C|nr:sialic acid-binding Ig-like lectin 15 isoform X2 [Monopterus albus]